MTANYTPRVGDIGVDIKIDMAEDISLATALSFAVIKPDGTTATWTATLSGTQYMVHRTVAGDLSVAGIYSVTPILTLGLFNGKGQPFEFIVYG